MKLNPDCVRDILIYLEENLTMSGEDFSENPSSEYGHTFEPISYVDLSNALSYSESEIVNTLTVLEEAGFLCVATDMDGSGRIVLKNVYRITYSGYQFIENIRPETIWGKIKTIGSKIENLSIPTISSIAGSIISSMISSQLNH